MIYHSDFYKVCNYNSLIMKDISVNFSHLPKEFHLIYELHQWTRPKHGKIYVFSNFRIAQRYSKMWNCPTIFKCQVVNPQICKNLCALTYLNQIMSFIKFKKYTIKPPQNTIEVDAVRPIEKIQ